MQRSAANLIEMPEQRAALSFNGLVCRDKANAEFYFFFRENQAGRNPLLKDNLYRLNGWFFILKCFQGKKEKLVDENENFFKEERH